VSGGFSYRRSGISRRRFLQSVASAAAYSALSPRTRAAAAMGARELLHEFDYSAVRLTGGPLRDHYERIFASYLALDNDRLLKVYRQRAGLDAPGEDMGGWYDADGFVPGHGLGQYISGLARYARATGEPLAMAKVGELVAGYARAFDADRNPFASPIAETTWPCYILDKHHVGLIDAAQLTGNNHARNLLPQVTRAALPYIPDHTYDRGPDSPKKAPYDETYILSENLFEAWQLTDEHFYHDLATKYLLNREYYLPLARGENILPGKHAYSHVISLSSAAKAWLALGDPEYRDALRNAWEMIDTTQRYASGGWGPSEAFVVPHEGRLYDSLSATQDHFETPCGFYAQAKLSRYLLRFTADGRYGDGLERALYNTILGAKDPDGEGNSFYYSGYGPRAQKGWYQKKWPCCSGTLVQSVSDYPLNVGFQNNDSVFVNLFTPFEIHAHIADVPVTLTQRTDYPFSGDVELHIAQSTPAEYTLAIRVPAWAGTLRHLRVNGASTQDVVLRQGFAQLRRRWRNGDTLDFTVPLDLRTEPIDDRHPETVALMRGPLMMVAATPPAGLESTPLDLPRGVRPLAEAQAIFEYPLPQTNLQLRPWFTIHDELYTTYFRIRAQQS
jgi:uncharacterized protein